MNRKQLTLVIGVACVLVAIGGTLYANSLSRESAKDVKLEVVASFYPLAYMSERIGGEHVAVNSLVPPGVEIHGWEPKTQDIVACNEADIIVLNGAGLDQWFEDDILPAINASNKVIVITTRDVELILASHEDQGEEHGLYDPHTWISPKTALQQAEEIYNAFIQRDPSNENDYKTQWDTFRTRLENLHSSYLKELSNKKRENIFTTHEAFSYLADGYGFEQHGIVGITADQQPSVQKVAEIVDLMVESNTYVFYLEPGYSEEYVQTIQNELKSLSGRDVQVLRLYHMDGPLDGLDYLQQMERNLINVKMGLVS